MLAFWPQEEAANVTIGAGTLHRIFTSSNIFSCFFSASVLKNDGYPFMLEKRTQNVLIYLSTILSGSAPVRAKPIMRLLHGIEWIIRYRTAEETVTFRGNRKEGNKCSFAYLFTFCDKQEQYWDEKPFHCGLRLYQIASFFYIHVRLNAKVSTPAGAGRRKSLHKGTF